MKALRLENTGKLELVETEKPEAGETELLVKTGASTICTSDLNDIKENPFKIKLPVIMGHEGSGTVVETGKKAKNFKPGDRIAAHPVHHCGKCYNCKSGMNHLCLDMKHFGLNMQGTFAEYFVVREDRARKIPDSLDFATAALAEPVSVCLEALKQADLKDGDTLLIIGDGPFGIIIARLAEVFKLSKIVVSGHHDFRLSFARNAVKINTNNTDNTLKAILKETGNNGYDAVILAVGNRQAVSDGLGLLKSKGRLVVFSGITGDTPLDLFKLHVRELEIKGACNDNNRLDGAIKMLSDKKLDIKSFVTQKLSIEKYKEAFELAEKGRESAIKVAIVF
jgi:2-desacetyl-2-hydroxyethyl bacteriochlorophyllide A dehydrogenase